MLLSAASIYTPLNATLPEIRVLRLLPSADFDAAIECRLITRPLHGHSGDYEALSYVWGSPECIREIMLNDEPYLITRNLEMALRYLRLSCSDRVLWIDALCVNQSDPVERSQQVVLMKDIYANSAADIAWLLEYKEANEVDNAEDQDAMILTSIDAMGEAMELLKNIALKDARTLAGIRADEERILELTDLGSFDEKQVVLLCDARLRHRKAAMEDDTMDLVLGKKEVLASSACLDMPSGIRYSNRVEVDDRERAITDMERTQGVREADDRYFLEWDQCTLLSATFSRPSIWERVWTMQELSLAPRVILLAGHYQLDWSIISDFFADQPYADAFHALFGHGLTGETLSISLGGAQKVEQQRRISRHGLHDSSLLDVLTRFQSNKATDPRDHIYGLLGLVKDQHSITVDYTKKTPEVFMDTALSLIRTAGNLDLLCQATVTTSAALEDKALGKGVLDLPTWVPDFSQQVKYDAHSHVLFAQRGIYAAGRPSLEGTWEAAHAHSLQLRAIILGRLEYDVPQPDSTGRFGVLGLLEKYDIKIDEAKVEQPKSYISTAETAFRALWRTLMMDCTAYPITRLTGNDIVSGEAAFSSFFDYPGGGPRPPTLSQYISALGNLPGPMRLITKRNNDCWEFCVTDNGLYTMVQKVKQGDVIASVEGAKVPLVLRPRGKNSGKETYDLVGTAYVHGYMDGEALIGAAEGRLCEEEVYLQ